MESLRSSTIMADIGPNNYSVIVNFTLFPFFLKSVKEFVQLK